MRRGRNQDNTIILLLVAILRHVQSLPFVPVVTLTTLAALILLHEALPPRAILSLAISAQDVLRLRPFSLPWLLTTLGSQLVHLDSLHLYYNSLSFLHKGTQLERPGARGPLGLALLLLLLWALTPALYVALACLASPLLPSLFASRAVGFSGVIFGLKAVLQVEEEGHATVGGMRVPAKLAAWAELVAIQLVTPNASFLGHLAGILAGLLVVAAERAGLLPGRRGAGGGGRGGGEWARR